MFKSKYAFIIGALVLAQGSLMAQKPLYKDPKQPTEARVKDLLGRMSLEEKVAQTLCLWEKKPLILDAKGNFDPKKAAKVIPNGLGQLARVSERTASVGRSPRETVILANQIQKYFIEKTRLGIPVIFHEESLHGNQAKDATNFPTPLGLASSWNPALISQIFTAVAEEVRVRGGHQVLAPVVDLARDPRWGRTEETYGEDPYLASRMGVAAVRAYQGSTGNNIERIDKKHVVATLKHFPVHGTPEGGVNIAPAFVDERTVRDVNLPPFKACVQEAGALGVMPCYNELSGVPAHANKRYINGILRKEWGFKGIVVSDYFAITELMTFHHVAKDSAEAALLAMKAGVDVELPDRAVYPRLAELIKSGKLTEATLDTAVSRILRLKFMLGLFEEPYANADEAEKVIGSAANRELARKAAQEAMVLLKNNDNVLPINKAKVKRIALIGPNTDRAILGGYSNEPKQRVTPLQAIRERYGKDVEILYHEGVKLTDKGDWWTDPVQLAKPEENKKRIQEAVEVAKKADVVIYFLGGNEALSREAWSKTHMGDLTNLELLGNQNDLIDAVQALGKPSAAFVFSGQPLTFRHLNEKVPAIVQCWFLGQETGAAVADVLFGEVNPSGKLPISMARSVGHLPAYYSYKPSGRRGYLLDTIAPLYHFGHGLSYTTFKYSNLKNLNPSIGKNGTATITVDVTNTGKVRGAEVVQLYVRDQVSSVTRPVKELKRFEKITLEPGQTKTVTFILATDALAFHNLDMQYVVEPGDFEIMVGTSSDNTEKVLLTVTE